MIKHIFRLLVRLALWFFAISILLVLLFKWLPVVATPLMLIRHFQHPEEDLRHHWVPGEEISDNLKIAVIASEDQNFIYHSGFDFEAIEKVIENRKEGVPLRGASTISQQTAKNVFLWPHRSWLRKGFETYFTFLIEIIWGKERILEVYLNSIEMGKGIYGAEEASQYWFHKNASQLSRLEAASIAAVLPNPREYKARPASNYIRERTIWILNQMQNLGPLILD